jgi:amidase
VFISAKRTAQMIAHGEISASDVVESCLTQIKRYNTAINAIVTLNESQALSLAKQCDDKRSTADSLPPLHGIPISIKDAFETAGIRTTCSHPPLFNYVPDKDATVVARLKSAGGIVLGKTNLPELAANIQCRSPIFGQTNNPWHQQLTPGGSSGGSAAAVAMGFSMLDPGSDMGGSIRIPAAYCGVTGLKATENRIPRTGHIPPLPGTDRAVRHFISFGLLARHVEDLKLGLDILSGPDGVDLQVSTVPEHTRHKVIQPHLRIAWWDEFSHIPLCRRTRKALKRTVDTLKAHGHQVERCRPQDFDFEEAWYAYGVIAGAELGLNMPKLGRRLLALAGKFIPSSQPVTRYFMSGLSCDFKRYSQALSIRERMTVSLEAFLDNWDAWICPVAPTVAYPHCQLLPYKRLPRIFVDDLTLPYLEGTISMVIPFSLTGSPVVVLPAGAEDGIPVGLQYIGKRWQDDSLLKVCERIECILPGFTPPTIIDSGESSSLMKI